MSIYCGDFSNKADVEAQFHCGSLDDCHILFASYELGDYCGQAFVLFVQNARLYEINASHCSCYGLEDQWEPEETMLSALQHRIQHGTLNSMLGGYEQEVLAEIARLGLQEIK